MLLVTCTQKVFEAKDYVNANAEMVLEQIQHLYEIESHD